jgi:DNA-binding transcriptional MerR regulator
MSEALSIQQTAERTGVSAHTLRYYERIGLISPVSRAASGHRRYESHDLDWIDFLKCLRSAGMPIRDMQRYAELLREGDSTLAERIALLEEHRTRIEHKMDTLARSLDAITWKIEHYKEIEEKIRDEQEIEFA